MRQRPFHNRILLLGVAAFAAVFLLEGCGPGKPPPSGSARFLKQAHDSEDMAAKFEQDGKDVEALTMYREALDKVQAGLKCARANERAPFRTIQERLDPKIAELEMREKLKKERAEEAKKKAEEAKKVAALGKTDVSKDEDVKRKAEEEAKRKEVEDRAEQLKKLTADTAVKPARDPEADSDEDPAAAKAGSAEEKKAEAPKPPAGPFKEYGEGQKPPRLSIDKIEVRGEFIYAYVQAFNEKENNMRIARPELTFTTFQNADLCPADIYVEYRQFNKTAANPLEQSAGVITGGSHEIFATSAFQFVAVAQDKEKASRARKARITISFEDGSTWTVIGPEDAKPAAVDGLPGL